MTEVMKSTSVRAARELSARDLESAVPLTDNATNSRPRQRAGNSGQCSAEAVSHPVHLPGCAPGPIDLAGASCHQTGAFTRTSTSLTLRQVHAINPMPDSKCGLVHATMGSPALRQNAVICVLPRLIAEESIAVHKADLALALSQTVTAVGDQPADRAASCCGYTEEAARTSAAGLCADRPGCSTTAWPLVPCWT